MSETIHDRIGLALESYPGLPPGVVLGTNWLAQQVGATRQAVSHWRKDREPSLEWIEKLAAALQVEPCWLAFGQGPMRPVNAQVVSEVAEQVVRMLGRQSPHKGVRQAE